MKQTLQGEVPGAGRYLRNALILLAVAACEQPAGLSDDGQEMDRLETIWITGEPYESPDFGSGPYEAAGAGGGASGCTFDSERDCFDGGGGGGSGSGSVGDSGEDKVPDYSCPMADRDCLKKLTSTERNGVELSILQITGPPTECSSARGQLQNVFDAGHIYKGDSTIADAEGLDHNSQGGLFTPNDGSPPYYVVHIDQDFLDAATVQALGAVLVHQGFHLDGYSHPATERYPYATPPFDLQDTCVGA